METQSAKWVHRTLEGETDCFAHLVRRYRDAVYGLAYHRLGDFSAAEDIAQEAFVVAFERLRELREPAKFAPWLRTIARNLCGQHLRKRASQALEDADEPSAEGLEQQVAARDLVHRALSALPPDNGLAITLYYVDGYDYSEIASFLDVPQSTVRGRLERGRRQLQKEMVAMMREQFDEHKPGEELTEMVIKRISAKGAWRIGPRRAQGTLLGEDLLLIDGELAQCRFYGLPGMTELEAQSEIWSHDRKSPLCVFRLAGGSNCYYLFGKARVEPDGPEVENCVLQVELRATPLAQHQPRLAPWQPERVSSAELWAMSPQRRDAHIDELYQRVGATVMLDGGLGHFCLINAGPGGGTCSGGSEVYIWNRGQHALNVIRRTWPRTQYYLFGKGEAVPPGLLVEDGIVEMQAVCGGSIAEAAPAGDPAAMPEFSSAELWTLSPEEQYQRLGGNGYVRIDGHLCSVKVTGGQGTNLVATAPICTVQDETMALYRLVGDSSRYYLFGPATVPNQGLSVADEVLTCELTARAMPALEPGVGRIPELSGRELCAVPEAERDDFLRANRIGGLLFLDGALARACQIAGPPGSSCCTPGGEVCFSNVGPHSLHVFRTVWPEARYYVFGQAEAAPPGLRVRDAVVTLEGRRPPQ